ncbi:MAG: ATP-binding cassette domain-containing protein [Gemmatimonadaceae bacterium]
MVSAPLRSIAPSPIVELVNVSRRWHPGILGAAPAVDALRGVTLQLFAGELVALTGAAGAGKSALLMLATGEVAPTSGVVRWGDREEPSAVRPQRIGPRPWEYPSLSVRQALVFHADHLRRHEGARRPPARLQPLLRRVGLAGRARTPLGALSALEAFRVVVAQALLARPALLCCDEPFAYCGPRERVEAVRLLRRLTGTGIAVLFATRTGDGLVTRPEIDRSITLVHGRLMPSGPVRRSRLPLQLPGLDVRPPRRRARVAEDAPPI